MKFQFTNFFKGSFISKILTIILLIILFFIFSCTPPESISGCVKETACNYNSEANEDDGSCMYTIYGCTDTLASNYNPLATVDDMTCTHSFKKIIAGNYDLFMIIPCNLTISFINDEGGGLCPGRYQTPLRLMQIPKQHMHMEHSEHSGALVAQ